MSARAPRDGIARHYYTLRYPGAPRGGAVVGSVARLWAGMLVYGTRRHGSLPGHRQSTLADHVASHAHAITPAPLGSVAGLAWCGFGCLHPHHRCDSRYGYSGGASFNPVAPVVDVQWCRNAFTVVVCYAICQLLMAPGARGICSLIRCHFGRRRRLGQRADWAGVLASFAGATFWVVRHVLGLLWDYMY
jgi:hypothetical protein